MFATILRTQWAWTRLHVAGIALLAFVAPVFSWRLVADPNPNVSSAFQLIEGFAPLSVILTGIALLGPFLLAALPWTIDAETKHVYPLSLPMKWSQFISMRFAAGALTLLIPAAALYLGSVAVVAMVDLPPLLRAYPGALTLRFLLAMLVTYGAAFALQYLAGRRAAIVVLLALIAMMVIGLAAWMIGAGDAIDAIGRFLFTWPGPFAIYAETWTLIDV